MAISTKVVILIETNGTYGRSLLKGIVRYARLHGPWSFYLESNPESIKIESLKNWKPNGIIMRDRKSFLKLLSFKLPTIIAADYFEPSNDVPNILCNEIEIGKMAAQHLLERGLENFTFCGFKEYYWSNQRCKGFVDTIKQAGFETYIYKEEKKRNKSNSHQSELNLMAKWIESLPKPLGLMASNDHYCQNIIEVCKDYNIKIPDEVSFIGVDNDELACELCDPPLSSVALSVEKAGFQAASLLDKMISGSDKSTENIIIEPLYVVTRQSTDTLAIKDEQVAAALRFIRDNARRPIQACDVVNATMVSRRDLYHRFRSTIGRSILEEIKRARVEEISRLLIETNMSISEIAFHLGFSDSSHTSRYFRQEKKMSPITYRNKYC